MSENHQKIKQSPAHRPKHPILRFCFQRLGLRVANCPLAVNAWLDTKSPNKGSLGQKLVSLNGIYLGKPIYLEYIDNMHILYVIYTSIYTHHISPPWKPHWRKNNPLKHQIYGYDDFGSSWMPTLGSGLGSANHPENIEPREDAKSSSRNPRKSVLSWRFCCNPKSYSKTSSSGDAVTLR